MDTNSYHEAATIEAAAKVRTSHESAARAPQKSQGTQHFPEGRVEFGRGWYHEDAMKSVDRTVAHKA